MNRRADGACEGGEADCDTGEGELIRPPDSLCRLLALLDTLAESYARELARMLRVWSSAAGHIKAAVLLLLEGG